ncbi:hypothetical protein OPV22_020284 [Ensete ventricosum]|uniref:Uncharacterized protein n=1 Tax=Ensete ventricosum TaxID=4639 RepID=A0AAV8QMY3_ENSVE|nr:hypothetical protein OPV22_020284 [Ensete ventricosum]
MAIAFTVQRPSGEEKQLKMVASHQQWRIVEEGKERKWFLCSFPRLFLEWQKKEDLRPYDGVSVAEPSQTSSRWLWACLIDVQGREDDAHQHQHPVLFHELLP